MKTGKPSQGTTRQGIILQVVTTYTHIIVLTGWLKQSLGDNAQVVGSIIQAPVIFNVRPPHILSVPNEFIPDIYIVRVCTYVEVPKPDATQ